MVLHKGVEEIMKIKEIVIRIGYMLLGAMLMLCIVLIRDEYLMKEMPEELEVVEIPIEQETVPEEVEVQIVEETQEFDFESEAEEKLQILKAEAEIVKQEQLAIQEEKTVSANSIEAAPVKWIKDYPKKISSDKLLEVKMQERSSYEETLAVNAFDKKVIENSTIDFSDVKIAIIGDSLTCASNMDEEEREKYAYPVILQEILGCKEIVNLGIGGSTISSVGDNAMVDRRHDVPMDSDIVIVFGGSNDALFENKWQYGDLEYNKRMKEDPTFCGDADKLFSKLQYYAEHNEDNYTKLICVNPPASVVAEAYYSIDPGNLIHQREFAKAINQISTEYGFEVIDFYNNNILNTNDRKVQDEFMPDGIHGNEEGYRIIAEHIASQIIQRIEQ